MFAEHGIEFHTQVVMSPGVNDGEVLRQTLDELYDFGPAILGCSVVPVGLTEYSKHHLVREPTAEECRAAIALVEERGRGRAARSAARTGPSAPTSCTFAPGASCRRPRSTTASSRWRTGWAPCAGCSGGSRRGRDAIGGWHGRRIGVVTGTAMARLMPMVLEPLARLTGATLRADAGGEHAVRRFGHHGRPACPGVAVQAALRGRRDLDLALLPGESVNDDGLFMDGMSAALLAAALPMEIRFSKDFVDALDTGVAA